MIVETAVKATASAALKRTAVYLTTVARQRNHDKHMDAAAQLLGQFDLETSLLRTQVDPDGATDSDIAVWLETTAAMSMTFEILTCHLSQQLDWWEDGLRERWTRCALESGLTTKAASSLFDIVNSHFAIVTKIIQENHPVAFRKLRDGADAQRMVAILENLRGKLEAPSPGPARTDIEAFTTRYKRQCLRAHGKITPPDLDRRRDVGIDRIYVQPKFLERSSGGTRTVDLRRSVDRTVILGDPGNGKSTASQVLVYELATESRYAPFLITLREFSAVADNQSVVQFIESKAKNYYQVEPPVGVVEHLLTSGLATVVFDGLDELLDTRRRRHITEIVHLFASNYPTCPILVTSRRVGYDKAPMDVELFEILELSQFDRSQIAEYCQKWFSLEPRLSRDEAESWTTSFLRESHDVHDLASNPLLLSLMCIMYRGSKYIPQNRPAVYQRCSLMLFETWDASRDIHSDLEIGSHVSSALKHLAHWMFTKSDADGVSENMLVAQMASYLKDRVFEDEDRALVAARQFVQFCNGRGWVLRDVGTTETGESLYKFTHQTFLEYFAALQLVRLNPVPLNLARLILPRVEKDEWEVVAQLALQVSDQNVEGAAEEIFSFALDRCDQTSRKPSERQRILAFLTTCLAFANVSASQMRRLSNLLLRHDFAPTVTVSTTSYFRAYGNLIRHTRPAQRDVVKDELQRAFSHYVRSANTKRRQLHLLEVLSVSSSAVELSEFYRNTNSNAGGVDTFWNNAWAEIESEFRLEYLELAKNSRHFAQRCVRRGWIDLFQFLNGDLKRIFDRPEQIGGGLTVSDLAFSVTLDAQSLDPFEREEACHVLTQVATYIRNANLPMIALTARDARRFSETDLRLKPNPRGGHPLSTEVSFAMAHLRAMRFELWQRLGRTAPRGDGAMSRGRAEVWAEIQAFDTRAESWQTLQAWGAGDLDFVG